MMVNNSYDYHYDYDYEKEARKKKREKESVNIQCLCHVAVGITYIIITKIKHPNLFLSTLFCFISPSFSCCVSYLLGVRTGSVHRLYPPTALLFSSSYDEA